MARKEKAVERIRRAPRSSGGEDAVADRQEERLAADIDPALDVSQRPRRSRSVIGSQQAGQARETVGRVHTTTRSALSFSIAAGS